MNRLAIHGGTPVRNTPIYYGRQYIDEADCEAVVEALKSDFLTTGPKIKEMERKLAGITGAQYAVAIMNGTAALHAACHAIGVQPGDEVITTPISFAASTNCVLYCGGTPVFADIDRETYTISPSSIRKKITDKTKAIIAVDFTGQPAALHEICEICSEFNLYMIEDAAHSLGTIYNGDCVGSIADMTIFSFHPVKTITAGEGGAITTNDQALYEKLLLFRTHGITRNPDQLQLQGLGPWYYEQQALGYNYRITDIQAALLISQMDKLPMFAARRKEIVKRYNDAFADMDCIVLQREEEGADSVKHLYIVQLQLEKISAGRNELYRTLAAENIICNVHYIPTYYFPYYQRLGYQKGLCPNAEWLYERILTIPLYYGMSDEDVESVIAGVCKVLEYYKV